MTTLPYLHPVPTLTISCSARRAVKDTPPVRPHIHTPIRTNISTYNIRTRRPKPMLRITNHGPSGACIRALEERRGARDGEEAVEDRVG